MSSLGLAVACSTREEKAPSAAKEPMALFVGGDVHLGHGRSAPLFEGLEETLGDRVGVVNLEGPVGAEPAASPDPKIVRLANAADALPLLSHARIRVAGVSNNHADDRGESSRDRTIAAVEAAGLFAAHEARPAIIDAGGLRVAVVALDLRSKDPDAGVLESARAGADVVIATFHVTGPPSYVPRPELRRAVDIALEAGATIVASHGTHAIGPVERRGDAVIAWGLGNLTFNCACTEEIDGALLLVTADGKGVEAAIAPIDAGLGGRPARPATNPALMFELLTAIGSTKLDVRGRIAFF